MPIPSFASVIVRLVCVGIVSTAGLAIAQEAGEDDALSPAEAFLAQYERTGETVTCLSVRRINQIRPLDDTRMLARVGAGQYYLNEVTRGCERARRTSTRLQYTTPTGRLCRNEIVQVIDNVSGIFVGSCSLGDFERLEKKPEDPSDS